MNRHGLGQAPPFISRTQKREDAHLGLMIVCGPLTLLRRFIDSIRLMADTDSMYEAQVFYVRLIMAVQ